MRSSRSLHGSRDRGGLAAPWYAWSNLRELLRIPGIASESLVPTAVVGLALALGLSAIAVGARRYATSVNARYLTVAVERGDIESTVMATGTLQAHQQVDVGAQVSGQLRSLKVQLGTQVRRGQLLAEIDPVLLQTALRSAQAGLESLQAQRRAVTASLWQAELAYKRQQEMLAREATSRQDVEAAKAQTEVLRANLASFSAQISQASAQVDSARANLDYTRITAPIDGEVVAVVTQEGQTVVAAQQAPVILKLAELDTMTVNAQISEADVIHIQPGQAAYFTILGDADERHDGTLRAVEPGPQDFSAGAPRTAGPVFYNALFESVNPGHRLRIGMTAQVTVVLQRAQKALSIPLTALGKRDTDGRYPVRVLRQGSRPAVVMTAIGINDHVNVQVLDGLAEGDVVIIAESGS